MPLPTTVATHVLQANETVHVLCWTANQVEVNAVGTIGADGTLALPYLPGTVAAGTSVADLQKALVAAYGQRFPGCMVYLTIEGLEQTPPSVEESNASALFAAPFAAGDQLYLKCWTNQLVYLEVTVTVSPDLTIALPPFGSISVKDETLSTLRDDLLQRYRMYYPSCSVEVLLTGHGGQALATPISSSNTQVPAWQQFPPDVTASDILTSLPRFGASVFNAEIATQAARLSAGAPTSNLPVPADYLIGPGDTLAIRSWSGAIEHYDDQVTVTPDGNIYVPLLGQLRVSGQTLAQVTNLLSQRFRKFFTDSQTSITVSQIRTVDVYVTGDVTSPGKYTLPGTATVFTALYAAGGPTKSGSLRDINLIRNGKPTVNIDLYPYLLTGERSGDQPLNPGDTVFVGPLGPTVGIAGLVRRPGLYEIKDPLTVDQALQMAAGIDPRGYAPNVEVWRVAKNTSWQVINLDLALKDATKGSLFKLQGGDLLLVRPVLDKPANTVEVFGAVRQPGIYEVEPNMDLATLLQRCQGLAETAYVQSGAVWRLTPTNDYRLLRFNVLNALHKQRPDDLKLVAGDKVYIYSKEDVQQPQEVSVTGAVANPGIFPWADQMRVSDLILQAKGLLPGAYVGRADLQRLTPEQGRRIIPVSLSKVLSGDANSDLVLQPGDQLVVYTQSQVGAAAQVTISGYVQNPGSYDRKEGMKVSDLIYQAGGLLPQASGEIEYTKGRTTGLPQITHLKLTRQGDQNFTVDPDVVLGDDDNVAVMGSGDFQATPRLVTINGQVAQPGSYALLETPGKPDTVYQLITRAGSLLPDANPAGIILYRTKDALLSTGQLDDVNQVLDAFNRQGSGQPPQLTDQAKMASVGGALGQQLTSLFNPATGEAAVVIPPRTLSADFWANAVPIDGQKLMDTKGKEGDMPLSPGDVVVVPTTPTTVAVIGAVVRPGAVKYGGPLTPLQYVNLAGGAATDAVLSHLVVIRANGSAVPASMAQQVQAGDVIVVPSNYMMQEIGQPTGLKNFMQTLVNVAAAFLLFRR